MNHFFSKIKEASEKSSFGLYVGAGLSIGAGLPSWRSLLSDLIDEAERRNTHADKVAELRGLLDDGTKYLMLAEEIRETLPSELEMYVRNKFDSQGLTPTQTLKNLVKIKAKFVLTTNYDTLIEKAFVSVHQGVYPKVFSYKDAPSINYNLWNGDYFILKIHGDARSAPNEIVLTEKDYRKIIYQQQGYQSVLHAIFSTNTMLFLGVSLSDPELLLLLGYIHNIFHGGSPMHYALIAKDSMSRIEIERWRKDFNIECVEYDPANQHKELENILEKIADENGELSF